MWRPPPRRHDPTSPHPPPTPPDAIHDTAAHWAQLLPSIRVVGRGGSERRVHGAHLALAALRSSEQNAAEYRLHTPFGELSHTRAPREAAASAPAGVARSTPRSAQPQPPPKHAARRLTLQDSASSVGGMGAGVARLSLGSPCSTACASPLSVAGSLERVGSLLSEGGAWLAEPAAAGCVLKAPAARGLDISGRVHGSRSFSDLLFGCPLEGGTDEGEEEAAALRKLGGGARLTRLDSGPLGGMLAP